MISRNISIKFGSWAVAFGINLASLTSSKHSGSNAL